MDNSAGVWITGRPATLGGGQALDSLAAASRRPAALAARDPAPRGPVWTNVRLIPRLPAVIHWLRPVIHNLGAYPQAPPARSPSLVSGTMSEKCFGMNGNLEEPMALRAEQANGQIQWLTDEEGRAFFDAQARRLLQMSGDESLRRWDAGEYDAVADDPGHSEVMQLAVLIPFAR